MKSKLFLFATGAIFLVIVLLGLNSALNLVDYFGSESSDSDPIFRNLLSVPLKPTQEQCNLEAKLPENGFWYGGNKCRWECLSGYEKNSQLGTCSELPEEKMIELVEIQAALDAQNGVGVVEEADPNITKEGVLLEGDRYYVYDFDSRCHLSMPPSEKLNGYNIPLKMTCDGKLMNGFNLDCIGKQKRATEGVLLKGDIQCLSNDLSKFFDWCKYEFKEEGLNGYVRCVKLEGQI